MPTPPISVCMPVYDAEAFVDRAIASIRAQSFADFEFVIVDDGSRDATAAIVERHQAEDPRLRLIRTAHAGIVAASNAALAAARGRYVARMDGDDTATPERLALSFDFLERHPEIGVVGGAAAITDSSGRIVHVVRPPLATDAVARSHLVRNTTINPTTLARRDLLVALGGYRKAFEWAEDTDLWLRVLDRAAMANLPEILVHVRRHSGEISFRHSEAQAVASAAARAAAALRRRGLPDPVGDAPALTDEHFARLGLSPGARHRAVVERLLQMMRLALSCNDPDQGWSMLQRIQATASPAEYLAGLREFSEWMASRADPPAAPDGYGTS